MKIVFFGTPEFAVPSLKSLYAGDIEISAVITQPDKPVGRKKLLTPSPVKQCAEALDLKVLQPKNKKALEEVLKQIEADFFIVIAYGMILPGEILKIPKYCCINIHASLLPEYRGASPIQEALLNGDKETGISIMKMDEKLDEGPIFLIKRVPIQENDDLESLKIKLAKVSSEILPHVLEDIEHGILTPIPQRTQHQKASYCRKIEKEDGKIDWGKSAEEIKNMIRAYTPWPSVYTDFHGKKLKIFEAETSDEKKPPGEFIMDGKILKIGTGNGSLIPKRVQLEGKKEINISDFINGIRVP